MLIQRHLRIIEFVASWAGADGSADPNSVLYLLYYNYVYHTVIRVLYTAT